MSQIIPIRNSWIFSNFTKSTWWSYRGLQIKSFWFWNNKVWFRNGWSPPIKFLLWTHLKITSFWRIGPRYLCCVAWATSKFLKLEFLDVAQAWKQLSTCLEKHELDIARVGKIVWQVPYTIRVSVFNLRNCR